MTALWSLTMALASLEAEVWSTTRFRGVGLIEPQSDGRFRVETHTPAATVSSFLGEEGLQPGGTAARVLEMWQLGPMSRTPIGSHGTELFAAVPEKALDHDDLATLREVARRLDLLSTDGEPAALRDGRLARIEALDDVLRALAGALDVRDVFGQLSDTARRVLPHDSSLIHTISEDRKRTTLYALNLPPGIVLPKEGEATYPQAFIEAVQFAIHHDLLAHPLEKSRAPAQLGLRSAIRLPIRPIGDTTIRVLTFSAFAPHQFTAEDVPIAQRIADYVALALSHQRLADEARDAAALRARAANMELLDELLSTLGESGELSEMFDRISAIAKRVLPHDLLGLPVLLPDGVHAKVYARSGEQSDAVPDVIELPAALWTDRDWEYDLLDDIQTQAGERDLPGARLGYRSVLRVPIRSDGKTVAALAFLSFSQSAYSQADVQVARRIADRVALLLSRERGLEASRRASEASARAAKLEARVRALTEELDARTGYRRVVGHSVPWKQVLTQATQVASTETTVLLLGESGTGKEVVARFVHRASPRNDGPFVALNCAALPEQLLEAELFGYERGAFTGATQSKPGQLEQAAGGTLFLDEVGEMSPQVQAKFLRVLQEKEFQRLGGTRVLRTDTRVIAATNRDLKQAMSRGQFREDLFYRLNVFAIPLPPLRDRPDDVLPLSEAFLAEYGRSLGRPPSGISKDARKRLMEYEWPGNVRELRNVLERAAILCDGALITAEHLAIAPSPPPRMEKMEKTEKTEKMEATEKPAAATAVPAPAGDIAAMERAMIEQALRKARFNKSKAAAALGLTRSQLYVRMRRYGLEDSPSS
jgi:transcriptional regulator with GAF, ATPase, and Fis domain